MKRASLMFIVALFVVAVGCSESDAPEYTAQSRVDEVGACATSIHTTCGVHMMEVMFASGEVDSIHAVEAGHFVEIRDTLTDYFHWLHSLATNCTDTHGHAVQTGELSGLGAEIWVASLLHRNDMMYDITSMPMAQTEERRYQLEMDAILQRLRRAHKALDDVAERYACTGPIPSPPPVPWVAHEDVGPASE